jgi:carbonic anhydrase
MACSNKNYGPLNIKSFASLKKKAVPCDSRCNFYYNFNPCPCILHNKGSYLAIISCKGSHSLEYNKVDLNVQSIKLYFPSLNKYDDRNYDGEIIIHLVGGGQNIQMCIPIKKSSSTSTMSFLWFNKFHQQTPTRNQKRTVNVSNFTLNNIIPRAGFCEYTGSLGDICDPKGKIILFNPRNAITISPEQLTNISSRLSNISKMYKIIDSTKYNSMLWNKWGTTNGPGKMANVGVNNLLDLSCSQITDEDGLPVLEDDRVSYNDRFKAFNFQGYGIAIGGTAIGIILAIYIIYKRDKIKLWFIGARETISGIGKKTQEGGGKSKRKRKYKY